MKKVDLPVHEHPLFLLDRFCFDRCTGCNVMGYFYGGYICNELGCNTLFHKECVKSEPEINHPSHPEHPLKLDLECGSFACRLCIGRLQVGYYCSVHNFGLHLVCAKKPPSSSSRPPLTLENPKVHKHPLLLSKNVRALLLKGRSSCKVCQTEIKIDTVYLYECGLCNLLFHYDCVGVVPDVYHTSHPKHDLRFFGHGAPGYADEKCLLCGMTFGKRSYNCDALYHCDVCNFTICNMYCVANPPPTPVTSPTTHEHQLHLIPRLINFTCNVCGMVGDRSPYFCLQCNFMIHRTCIDLPRIININRHNHRISYTRQLGHGNWTCGVCREKVDGFYGAYSCSRCPSFTVHASCAIRGDIWEKVELEETPEEEEIEPFEVIDENTIKHPSHRHNLRINKDGKTLHESKLCEACVSQIGNDFFYSCEKCDFILHETCASLPNKLRHMSKSIHFTLETEKDSTVSLRNSTQCYVCLQYFTGFKYKVKSGYGELDVRCSLISEPFLHQSHTHHLYYKSVSFMDMKCSACDKTCKDTNILRCDKCEYQLDFRCATLPRKIWMQRYDDHPLYLCYGENNVCGKYWCDVCETKVDPKKWFYTCNPCGITLHISCVMGDFSYHKPGRVVMEEISSGVVIANTSVCRPHCSKCSSRCKNPFILQVDDFYYCSRSCSKPPRDYWPDLDY